VIKESEWKRLRNGGMWLQVRNVFEIMGSSGKAKYGRSFGMT